jgi:hypothetical protein
MSVYIPGRDGVIKCADLAVKNDVVFSEEVGVFASRALSKINSLASVPPDYPLDLVSS